MPVPLYLEETQLPYDFTSLACNEAIKVEYWDCEPPLEGVYWKHPDLPPIIGLSKALFGNRKHFPTVLAEELGHHSTTAGNYVWEVCFHCGDRVNASRAEYRARKWAAEYLMPADKLLEALKHGITETWQLADHFEVDEELVKLRLRLARA